MPVELFCVFLPAMKPSLHISRILENRLEHLHALTGLAVVPWLFCTIPALRAPKGVQAGGFYCWELPCQSLRPNLVKVCAVQFLNVVWEQHEN